MAASLAVLLRLALLLRLAVLLRLALLLRLAVLLNLAVLLLNPSRLDAHRPCCPVTLKACVKPQGWMAAGRKPMSYVRGGKQSIEMHAWQSSDAACAAMSRAGVQHMTIARGVAPIQRADAMAGASANGWIQSVFDASVGYQRKPGAVGTRFIASGRRSPYPPNPRQTRG